MAQDEEKSTKNGFTFDDRNEVHPKITSDRIDRIELDGRDPATGKIREIRVRTDTEKRLAGEVASIESAPLD